ncbi:phosphate starvation-inducible protein PhoH [Halanaerobium salsuginis]|uniref:PhoH-like protein n=2 Tax=Halanaerobium salsuginis TaxID=29563 RepID=A0A1I4G9I4_9FIRM|nr:PhoH family protein [Halanaerobium salsuginis]SFL25967.1 phosphate starvation-inducible protein PhoH [Halanaerobium salsuginis]
MTKKEDVMEINDYNLAQNFFGHNDRNLKALEEILAVKLSGRGTQLRIEAESEQLSEKIKLLQKLFSLTNTKEELSTRKLRYAAEMLKRNPELNLNKIYDEVILENYKGRKIKAKTLGQKLYLEAIKNRDIVFSIGPAGTGKTYLAMVMAVKRLLNNEVNRIVLTRPAIEAGESLGFLPGDMQDKVDPYLRPLYDAVYDILGPEKAKLYQEKDIIEVAPLAYMRGRTLDDSFVILDEAQNTTLEQMKMFLTRIGFNSKAVITGDITQIDLPSKGRSGLATVQKILKNIKGIDFVYLNRSDVVRHDLVKEIIKAYESYESRK